MIEKIEERYPRIYACDWDNVGLLAGDREQEVRSVYIALDATDGVIDRALKEKADLLLTHHPMIFGSIKSVTTDDYVGERLIRLIRGNISYYAMHTNYDVMGMAELAASFLELTDTFVLEEVFDDDSLFECLRNRAQAVVTRSDKEIELCHATQTEGELLRVPQNSPLILVKSTAYLPTGEPLYVGTQVMNGEHFKLQITQGTVL